MYIVKECQLECTRHLLAVNTLLLTILYSSNKCHVFRKSLLSMYYVISIGLHISLHQELSLTFQLKLLH